MLQHTDRKRMKNFAGKTVPAKQGTSSSSPPNVWVWVMIAGTLLAALPVLLIGPLHARGEIAVVVYLVLAGVVQEVCAVLDRKQLASLGFPRVPSLAF